MRLFLFCFAAFLRIGFSATIDSIAVTVGNNAITESEITDAIRLTALANGTQPEQGLQGRREAADRLIEQALVRREMSFGSYPAISDQQVESAFESTEKVRGGSEALKTLLSDYALTAPELREYLRWQLSLLKFIEIRFRPAVQVTNEDVETYYKQWSQTAGGPDGKAPALNDVRAQIEEKLTGERVDKQMDDWMKRTRARTAIRYLDPSLAVALVPSSSS